jgi:hypothetical protein
MESHHQEEREEHRLSWNTWLVGKAKRWWGVESGAPAEAQNSGLWSALSRAAGGGCPYLSTGLMRPQSSAGREMRCPFAAAGQTELPPGHPMGTDSAAAKFVNVAHSVRTNTSGEGPTPPRSVSSSEGQHGGSGGQSARADQSS